MAAELSEHLRQVVLLAWSRSLSTGDQQLLDAAASPGSRPIRVEIITDEQSGGSSSVDPQIGTFVRLFSVSVLYGPGWLIRAARDYDDEVLALESTMIQLSASHGARSLGETTLYYAEDVPQVEPSSTMAVSFEPEDVDALEQTSPADDVTAAGISQLDSIVTLVPDDGQGTPISEAVAAAGYEEWEHLIGAVSALVRPGLRNQGLGTYASAVAMEEAFAAGLVPQWRAPMGHPAAQQMADRLGFVLSGSQTTVYFDEG